MSDRPLTRRRFLAGTGLVATSLTAGCSGSGETVSPRPSTPVTSTPASSTPQPSPVDPDAQLVMAVVRDQQRLVAAYRAELGRHRELRSALGALLDHHETHLDVLRAAARGSGESTPGRSVQQAVAHLRRLEADATTFLRSQANAASSGELARVLASMAASAAQHVVVLDGLVIARRGGRS